jgi:hypothetical protein
MRLLCENSFFFVFMKITFLGFIAVKSQLFPIPWGRDETNTVVTTTTFSPITSTVVNTITSTTTVNPTTTTGSTNNRIDTVTKVESRGNSFTLEPTDAPAIDTGNAEQLGAGRVIFLLLIFALAAFFLACLGIFFIRRKKRLDSQECLMDLQNSHLQRQSPTKEYEPTIVGVLPQVDMVQKNMFPKDWQKQVYFHPSTNSTVNDNGGTVPYPNFQQPSQLSESKVMYVDEHGIPYTEQEIDEWNQRKYH